MFVNDERLLGLVEPLILIHVDIAKPEQHSLLEPHLAGSFYAVFNTVY